jgi:predicted enzyme related to lactoylglutathione lyase
MANETLAAWIDLTVPDATRSRGFYADVLGVATGAVPIGSGDERYEDYFLQRAEDGAPLAGVCNARGANEGLPPVWIPYFTVASVDESFARALARGAAAIREPSTCGWGRMAFLRDPDGAVFAIITPAK